MEALQKHQVVDSRETVETESRYNTFEVLMAEVDEGRLSFDEAVAAYRKVELADLAIAVS